MGGTGAGADGGHPDGGEGVAASEFKRALARFPSGVVVLTVRDVSDEELGTRDDLGITATAFSSVSLDPPLVLVGIAAESYLAEVVARQDRWAVTFLAHAQKQIAGRFAMPGRPSARILLGGVPNHRGRHSDAMIVDGGLAALECRTHQLVPAGDHVLVLGEVVEVDYLGDASGAVPPGDVTSGPGAALVHYAGRYHRLDP